MTPQRETRPLKFYPRTTSPRVALGLVTGMVVGAGLMYLLDTHQGNRRRAVARDKVGRLFSRSSILAGKSYRHLRNQLEGVLASLTRYVTPEGAVSDRKLLDRIRSVVGRSIPHPGSVDFSAHEGRVTVRGYLKPHEAGQVVQAVERIPGVRSVDNQIVDSSAKAHPVQ